MIPLYDSFLQLLFPGRCAGCNVILPVDNQQQKRAGSGIQSSFCKNCLSRFEFIAQPFCSFCGCQLPASLSLTPLCGLCLKKQPAYELCRSICRYTSICRELICRLKFKGDLSTLGPIRELMGHYDYFEYEGCDLIAPVPLHKKRLRQRGFNQSLLLAEMLSEFLPEKGVSVVPRLLRKTENREAQTSLNARERRKMRRGLFEVAAGSELKNKTVCLVDDVFTTGTTVNTCSRVLITAGARAVKIVTLGRADIPS